MEERRLAWAGVEIFADLYRNTSGETCLRAESPRPGQPRPIRCVRIHKVVSAWGREIWLRFAIAGAAVGASLFVIVAASWLGFHYRTGRIDAPWVPAGIGVGLLCLAILSDWLGGLAARLRRNQDLRRQDQLEALGKQSSDLDLDLYLGAFGGDPILTRGLLDRRNFLQARLREREATLIVRRQPERLTGLRVWLARWILVLALASVAASVGLFIDRSPRVLGVGSVVALGAGLVVELCGLGVCALAIADLYRGYRRTWFRPSNPVSRHPLPPIATTQPEPVLSAAPSPILVVGFLAVYPPLLIALSNDSLATALQEAGIAITIAGGLLGFQEILASPLVAFAEEVYERLGFLSLQLRAADGIRSLLLRARTLARAITLVSGVVVVTAFDLAIASPHKTPHSYAVPLVILVYSWLVQVSLTATLRVWLPRQRQTMLRSAALHARLSNPRVRALGLIVAAVCFITGQALQFVGVQIPHRVVEQPKKPQQAPHRP